MGSTALSHATGGGHRHSSPQSVGVSTASSAYASHLSSSNLSPHLRVSAGLEVSAGHGLPLSQRPPSGHGMTQWGTTAHQMQYQSSLPPPGKAPWDYTYLNPVPATDVQTTAQTLHRSDLAADLSQISADNTYNTYGERTTRV